MAHGSAIWLPFVQPFATVALGVGAFLLAYRQWLTANEKFKLDFFDRRDSVLQDVLKDLHNVIQNNFNHRANMSSTYFKLLKMKSFFEGDTEEHIDSLIAAIADYIPLRLSVDSNQIDRPEFKEHRDEINKFYDIVTRVAPMLQKSALRDMKIRVPSFKMGRGKS